MFDTSRIHPMLDKVQTYLGKWLEGHLKQIYPTDWWERCVMSVLVPEQREHVLDDGAQTPEDLDLAMQITVFRGNWNLLRRKFHLNPQLYDDAAAVKRIRNKYSHKKSGKDYEERFEHDMETVKLFLKGLGAQNNLLNENLLTGLNENGIYGNQRNRNNQENVIMSYRDRVNGIKPISFRAVIDVAHQALPNSIRRAPWIGLEHGIVPLNTEQKLDQYLAAYGKMHVEKIRMSFGALETPSEDLRAPVSVVDWGCGQALATCSLFDWLLEDNNIGMGCIRRIHLIEPSNLAMERACINVDAYQRQYNANFDVKRINKLISGIQQDDFKIEGIQTNVHLLSNILDIETVDLDFLAEFIKHNFTGRQIFFCVGPLNQGASRIKEFAIKLGIPESDILSRCQGRLAQQHGTISMLTFIIDEGGASAKKIEFVPMAPVSVQDNIALQRVLKRYEAKQDVLDRITQFYQMATELEQIKEPSVRESTSFTFNEDNGTLSVSFADNNDFLVRCQENANPAITRWPKDFHFGFDVIWGTEAYRLLYYIKPMDELRDVNFARDRVDLKLRDFSVSIGCAESLELTDDKINIIEQHLHSDEVSWQSLGELLERVIGTGATLSTTQINVSFCDRNIALAQIYSELKRMDSYEIRRSQLLTAFLENAEIDNTVDSVLPEELIKVVPMDDSQREAVCRALNSRVSVVVGPPGCGKTQLILNLLANSVVRGKKVLVASKNNKAVDNVKDRFAVFDPNGCFLRFGAKKFIHDVTAPKIQGLLNLSQQSGHDDQRYAAIISRLHEAHGMLCAIPELEQEHSILEEDKFAVESRIKSLRDEIAEVEEELAGILPEFCESAKEQLERDIEQSQNEKLRQEEINRELQEELAQARIMEERILPKFYEKGRRVLDREFRECEEQGQVIKDSVKNDASNAQMIAENGNRELSDFIDRHDACARIDQVSAEEMSGYISALRKTRNEIEYRVSGLSSCFVRWFGKTRLAKLVLDTVAGFNEQVQGYLHGIDSRDSVSCFRNYKEIIAFCSNIEKGLSAVLNYRRECEGIRMKCRSEISRVEQEMKQKNERLHIVSTRISEIRECLANEEMLQHFVRRNYQVEIVNQQREAQSNVSNIERRLNEGMSIANEKGESIRRWEGILGDEHSLREFVNKTYSSQISQMSRKLEAQKQKAGRVLDDEQVRLDKMVSRMSEIAGQQRHMKELKESIASLDFGQEAVCLSLDHYLHADHSAQAITAYSAYLPENIPWRREEMSAFYHAAEKFLDVFRLESVTSLSVKSAFPLKEELFDMLVIDEASQCDVASALPLILRAKQVVVIGDPMQLRHISRVEPEEELAIKRHLNLSGAVHLKYADASLWDYTRNWLPWCENARPCVLENHYRCHPNIIGYSNEMFYNTLTFGGLNVCTANRPNDGTPQGIIWKDIRGTQVNGSTNVNMAEVNEVIRAAVAYANGNPRLTIGIVTPFSAQAERINKRIPTQLRGRIVADTVHKFQGDEKDVMIYSLVVTDNSPDGKIKWIDYKVPNLVNVAVTRAKQLLVIVGNKTYIRNHSRSNLPLGHLVAYVDRVNAPGNNENGIRR